MDRPDVLPAGFWDESYHSAFLCPVYNCYHSYRRKGDLKKHMREKHEDRVDLAVAVSRDKVTKEGKPFACPFPGCRSGYSRLDRLTLHVDRVHRGMNSVTDL